MDGAFLTGKYKGTILIAVAADANDQLLPVAFAIVESENTDSWLWFLAIVKRAVVQDRPGVCVISDRNAGLLSAFTTMQNKATDGLRRGRTSTSSQFLGMLGTIYDDSKAAMRTITCGRHSDVAAPRGGHRGQPPSPSPSAPPSAPPSTRPSHSRSRCSYGRSSSTRLGLGQAHLRGDSTLLPPSSSRREMQDWTSSLGPWGATADSDPDLPQR